MRGNSKTVIIAIAIDKVTAKDKYATSVKSMNEKIRLQKPRKGVDRVLVPGDRNLSKKMGMNDDSEIEVAEEYIIALSKI